MLMEKKFAIEQTISPIDTIKNAYLWLALFYLAQVTWKRRVLARSIFVILLLVSGLRSFPTVLLDNLVMLDLN